MRARAAVVLGLVLFLFLTACVLPIGPTATPQGWLILRIRNHRPTEVAVGFDGHSRSEASSMIGSQPACFEGDMQFHLEDDWTFSVDGTRVVGATDRLDLRPSGPPRTMTVTIEIDSGRAWVAGVIAGRLPEVNGPLPDCPARPSPSPNPSPSPSPNPSPSPTSS